MMRVTLVAVTAAVWLGVGVVVVAFLVAPAFESEPQDKSPVTIRRALLLPAEATQLGRPPTRDWPRLLACPESLATECPGGQMGLVATVNVRRGSSVNSALLPYSRLALCRWPVDGAGSCEMVGKTGAIAKAESAMYALPD